MNAVSAHYRCLFRQFRAEDNYKTANPRERRCDSRYRWTRVVWGVESSVRALPSAVDRTIRTIPSRAKRWNP